MTRRRKRGLQDEGEVEFTVSLKSDPKPPEKFRIVFPADDERLPPSLSGCGGSFGCDPGRFPTLEVKPRC